MADFLTHAAQGLDLSKNFIRGAARILTADLSQSFPVKVDDVVRTAVTETNELQTITITGTPTGGTFKLTFKGYTTATIAYNAAAAAVQSALEALQTIGAGGVLAGGGPLPGTAVTITFQNQLGGIDVPMLSVTDSALTGGTTPAVAVAETTKGFGQWSARSGWTDLGTTKGGITVNYNNTEETFDVDQILADILAQPTAWTLNCSTRMAQPDLDLLQYLWEGGTITTDTGSGDRFLPLGTPSSYTHKRLAVAFQRQSLDGGVTQGGVQIFVFRDTTRAPQESSIAFNKTGEQSAPAFQWRAFPDSAIQAEKERFGGILDEK